MIRRDRSHASITFWSIGNEINEAITPRGVEITTMMRAASCSFSHVLSRLMM